MAVCCCVFFDASTGMFQSPDIFKSYAHGLKYITEALRGHDEKEIPVSVVSDAETTLWASFVLIDSIVYAEYICHVQETTQCTVINVLCSATHLLGPAVTHSFQASSGIVYIKAALKDES